jgi:hypothetical protein
LDLLIVYKVTRIPAEQRIDNDNNDAQAAANHAFAAAAQPSAVFNV